MNYYSLLLLLFNFNVFSQIQVLDSESKVPIEYANIDYILNGKSINHDYTDLNGKFNLKNIGYDNIIITCMGFQSTNENDLNSKKIIYLSPKNLKIDDILVTNKTLPINDFTEDLIYVPGYGLGMTKQEIGMVMKNPYLKEKVVKNVLLYVRKKDKNNIVIRFHVYKVNESNFPMEELDVKNNSYTLEGKIDGIYKINVSESDIIVPAGNFMITIEILSLENKIGFTFRTSNYLQDNLSFLKEYNRPWVNISKSLEKYQPVIDGNKPNIKIGLEVFE